MAYRFHEVQLLLTAQCKAWYKDKLLQGQPQPAQQCQHAPHPHRSPCGCSPCPMESKWWLLCDTSCSYLEKRHLSGLLNEKMQLINLLANQRWDWIAASNDTLGLSKERWEKFSVLYLWLMLSICIQRMCKWTQPQAWLWQHETSQINCQSISSVMKISALQVRRNH